MGIYTDAKGDSYELLGSNTAGEIVILSDDKSAWRIPRETLINSSSNELLIPDVPTPDLALFLGAIQGKFPPPSAGLSVSSASKAIEVATQYDCIDAAESLLFHATKVVMPEEQYAAFVLAAKLGSVRCAVRILAQGHRWYAGARMPVGQPLFPRCHYRPWNADDARAIPSDWLWALQGAELTCRRWFGELDGMRYDLDEMTRELADRDPNNPSQTVDAAPYMYGCSVPNGGFFQGEFHAPPAVPVPAANAQPPPPQPQAQANNQPAAIAPLPPLAQVPTAVTDAAYRPELYMYGDWRGQQAWRMIVGEFTANLLE